MFIFLLCFILCLISMSGKQEGHNSKIINKSNSEILKDNKYSSLDKIVNENNDKIVVSIVPLENDDTPYYKNENRTYVSASMIKLLILAEFIEQIDKKEITLETKYILKEEDIVGGSGIIQNMTIGTEFEYDTLALYMIMYSDNTATNVLIDILGMDRINEKSKKLGLKDAQLNRKMMQWNGTENYINSKDIEILLKGFINNSIGSEKMCKKSIEYLLKTIDNNAIAKGLPNGTKFAHKTGDLTKIRHDGGIVYVKMKYIIIVLTKGFEDINDSYKLMANISYIAYNIIENNDYSNSQNYLNYVSLFAFILLFLF